MNEKSLCCWLLCVACAAWVACSDDTHNERPDDVAPDNGADATDLVETQPDAEDLSPDVEETSPEVEDTVPEVVVVSESTLVVHNDSSARRYVQEEVRFAFRCEEEVSPGETATCRIFAPGCTMPCPDNDDDPFPCIMCEPPPPMVRVLEAGQDVALAWPHNFFTTRPIQACSCWESWPVPAHPITLTLCAYDEVSCVDAENPWLPDPVPCPAQPDAAGRFYAHGEGEPRCYSLSFSGDAIPETLRFALD